MLCALPLLLRPRAATCWLKLLKAFSAPEDDDGAEEAVLDDGAVVDEPGALEEEGALE